MYPLETRSQDPLVSSVRAVFPVKPAFVTESDEMVAVERFDVGGHGLYPVGDRGRRACSGRGSAR